jgi:hypothetical protein
VRAGSVKDDKGLRHVRGEDRTAEEMVDMDTWIEQRSEKCGKIGI